MGTLWGTLILISLPTRLTNNTATLIDNILTSNLEERVETGVVTVRISDHLPVFAFVGGRVGTQGGGRIRGCRGGWSRGRGWGSLPGSWRSGIGER